MKNSIKKMFQDPIVRFTRDEDGAVLLLALFLFIVSGMVGALALDYSRLVAARTQLQVSADLAAHAALYHREFESVQDAKTRAIEAVSYGMPESKFGEVLAPTDIHFGTWDYDEQEFTIDETSRKAVLVTSSRISDKLNSVESFLFRLVGRNEFDVVTQAVYTTYRPACLREGFVAEGIVDLQSNNSFVNGFCIHSNTHVSINQNNTFEPGTIVSMPDENDIDLPNSGFDKNAGLEEALRSAKIRLRIVNRIEDLIDGLATSDPFYTPSYIVDATPVYVNGKNNMDETDFVVGRINILNCGGNPKATLSPSAPLTSLVIVTNCNVQFSQGTHLEDVVIATTSTSSRSFSAPSSLFVGLDDDCAEGGGAQLVTMGGMNFASNLHLFGGQLLAVEDIEFSANANGVEGASMVSGATISGTSNMSMGFCNGSGMEDNFEADYFRMAA